MLGDRLSGVDLTAIAAFAAAGLSLVNVGISYRLSRRGHLEEWRRGELRPVVARIITLSRKAQKEWAEAALARTMWLPLYEDPDHQVRKDELRSQEVEHWSAARKLYDDMAFQVAELDLIAGPALRDSAKALLIEHEGVGIPLRPAGPCNHPLEVLASNKVGSREQELVAVARVEIGVDRRPQQRARMLRVRLPHLRQLRTRSAKPAAPATPDGVVGQ